MHSISGLALVLSLGLCVVVSGLICVTFNGRLTFILYWWVLPVLLTSLLLFVLELAF